MRTSEFLKLWLNLYLQGYSSLLFILEMETIACSQARTIYPDLATQSHIPFDLQDDQFQFEDSRLDTYSISSSDDERYFFSTDLQEIRMAYLGKEYQQVVLLAKQAIQRFRESARSELIKKNVANLTLDLSKLRSLMANAYINLYRSEKKQLYLLRARNCLSFEYEGIETPYKRAQRLNNLGLCELLRGRCNNAFHHFSNAFRTYLEDGELRLGGLVKNIGEVYKQLEMFPEAIRYFSFVLEELDSSGSADLNEYVCVMVSALESINESQYTTPHHLPIYQRVKQLIPKLDKERMEDALPKAKLRLEILKFGIGFGIAAKCMSEQEIEAIFHEIFNLNCQEPRLKLLKGQCCYAYREYFRGHNWEKFRQLSRLAEICFNSALRE